MRRTVSHLFRSLVLVGALVAPLMAGSQPAAARVVTDAGAARPEVVAICDLVAHAHGLELPMSSARYSGLEALAVWAGETLRRPAGSERMSEASRAHAEALIAPLSAEDRHRLLTLFAQIGDVGAVAAPAGTYDYLLVHGTLVPGMRRRLHALAEAVQAGDVRLSERAQVVFLDGQRPLFASETPEVLRHAAPFAQDAHFRAPDPLPTDERDAAEMVWQQLALPEALRRLRPVFAHALAQPGAARAETDDAVRAWIRGHHPRAGRALMVSESPFVEYQRLVTERALRRESGGGIALAAMGSVGWLEQAPCAVHLGGMLDNLAATLRVAADLQAMDMADVQSALQP